MSHTNAAALRTTYWVPQIGSKLARSACGTKRSARAAARWEIAGVASPPKAVTAPAPVSDLRNALRSMDLHPVIGSVAIVVTRTSGPPESHAQPCASGEHARAEKPIRIRKIHRFFKTVSPRG